ncbi:hypothetical protein HY17_06320 [Hyphomonas sp. CY54-11-8]|nr:hypothetical protein HY17_06320 [Hyphomonas sp. CY54-11-8]
MGGQDQLVAQLDKIYRVAGPVVLSRFKFVEFTVPAQIFGMWLMFWSGWAH